jgi:hypothetical protein
VRGDDESDDTKGTRSLRSAARVTAMLRNGRLMHFSCNGEATWWILANELSRKTHQLEPGTSG